MNPFFLLKWLLRKNSTNIKDKQIQKKKEGKAEKDMDIPIHWGNYDLEHLDVKEDVAMNENANVWKKANQLKRPCWLSLEQEKVNIILNDRTSLINQSTFDTLIQLG